MESEEEGGGGDERTTAWMDGDRRDGIILAESSYGEPQREGTAKMRLGSMFVCV